jgi:hypothetical protein
MWPISDAWGGDCTYISEGRIWVQPGQNQTELALAEGFSLHRHTLLEGKYGCEFRWSRNDWQPQVPAGYPKDHGRFFLMWTKTNPRGDLKLCREYDRGNEHKPGYGVGNAFKFTLETGDRSLPLEGANWADWDRRGRLVFTTRSGTLCAAELAADVGLQVTELANFDDQEQEPTDPPPWATSW